MYPFDLLFLKDKPHCEITRREINDEDTLICIGDGNPDKVKDLILMNLLFRFEKKDTFYK